MNKINLTRSELNDLLLKVSVYFKDITLSSDGSLKAKVHYDPGTNKRAVTETMAVLLELSFKNSKVSTEKEGVLKVTGCYVKSK